MYKHIDDIEPAFFCPLEYSAIAQVQPNGALSKKLEVRSVVETAGSATPRLSRARSANGGSGHHGPEAGRTMVFEATDERSAKEWLRAVQQFTLNEGILVVPQDELEAWERSNGAANGAGAANGSGSGNSNPNGVCGSLSAPAVAGGLGATPAAPLSPRGQAPPPLRTGATLGAGGGAGAGAAGACSARPGAAEAAHLESGGGSFGGASSAGGAPNPTLRERRALNKQLQLSQRALRLNGGAGGGAVAPAGQDASQQLVRIERYYEAIEVRRSRRAPALCALARWRAGLRGARGGAMGAERRPRKRAAFAAAALRPPTSLLPTAAS